MSRRVKRIPAMGANSSVLKNVSRRTTSPAASTRSRSSPAE